MLNWKELKNEIYELKISRDMYLQLTHSKSENFYVVRLIREIYGRGNIDIECDTGFNAHDIREAKAKALRIVHDFYRAKQEQAETMVNVILALAATDDDLPLDSSHPSYGMRRDYEDNKQLVIVTLRDPNKNAYTVNEIIEEIRNIFDLRIINDAAGRELLKPLKKHIKDSLRKHAITVHTGKRNYPVYPRNAVLKFLSSDSYLYIKSFAERKPTEDA